MLGAVMMSRSDGRAAGVFLRNLTKDYGRVRALDGINLDIRPGELISLLGPSGSGKTTLMMAIAGFLEDFSGEILFDDRPVAHLPPEQRGIGIVFQHLALFPHMTVADNIAYPLRMRGVPPKEIVMRIDKVLTLVKLPGMGTRMPAQLSGGQQQRVAFARAIVFEPKILLLDEPLAALDKKLREEMQREIRAIHRELGVTIIHITHDQLEALSISDRIVVMNEGRIEHVGAPAEVYSRPHTRFVAEFVGDTSVLAGAVTGETTIITAGGLTLNLRDRDADVAVGDGVVVLVRPECVRIAFDGAGGLSGRISAFAFQGDRTRYEIALNAHDTVNAVVSGAEAPRPVGTNVSVGWDAADLRLFPAPRSRSPLPN
jgi:putative spermidine/putrescine transport system ATP-binding protein